MDSTTAVLASYPVASFPGRKNERPGTHCMHMRSIPQNLGNPVISVNYCSFSRLENETSLVMKEVVILINSTTTILFTMHLSSIDLFHARIYGNVDDVIVGGVYVSHASWWDKSLGRR